MVAFYFQLEVMSVRRGIRLRHGANGRWLPPKRLGNNVKMAQDTPSLYHHNGRTTEAVTELPEGARVHGTYSIYHDQAVFWTVDYDATREAVADGLDNDSGRGRSRSSVGGEDDEDSNSDEERDDWRPMSFQTAQDNEMSLSYAGRRLPFRTLLTQRSDQLWAQQLLTDIYQAPRERRTEHRDYGGLVGDLPLLIGLAAMSLPASPPRGAPNATVYHILPHMIVGDAPGRRGWQVLSPQRMPRSIGWTQQRGIVITVYHDPKETSEEDLREYERGAHGPIFA